MEQVKDVNFIKKSRVKAEFNVLTNNFYILKLAWRICPKRVVADFFVNGISYFLWVFNSVFFIKYILSAIESNKSFQEILPFVIGTMIMFACLEFYTKWYNTRFKPITDNKIYASLNKLLFEKAAEVELACYEDTEFYNTYTLAIKEADSRVISVLSNIFSILFGVISAVCVFINMYSIDKYVALFVISPLIGNFFFGKKLKNFFYERDVESISFRRKMDYVNRTVYLKDYSKEIRLSGIFNVLRDIYEEGYGGIAGVIKKYMAKVTVMKLLSDIFTFPVIFQGVLLYSAYRTIISKTMALSSFAVLTSAMVTVAWILIGLSDNIITTFQNSLYIENLRKFLSYESKIPENQEGIRPKGEIEAIELKNISFTYKGQEKPSLEDINIRINGREKIALVGHNGAGKTSLIKLLMRLYDPDKGEILVNNVNIKDYNLMEYRNIFGTAFQDYQVFSMTVAENVLMKELENEAESEIVKKVLQESGVYEKVMSLNNTIDTVLTREFDDDGAVLSGGELQKIAVARVFAKEFPIVIFDEPSSALDPIAEYKLYESIMKVCRDKTVFFISHRLSSAILADKIYLLENGRVAEAGTHKELMLKKGKYADMFTKQAEKYIEEYVD